VDTGASLVSRLLAAQFPQWADLPIEPIHSAGTDNALYRLGTDMAVRLPRIHWAAGVDKEHESLPKLAPFLPLAIPIPLAKGNPGEGYPWQWSVYRWLEGENATIERIVDLCQAATDLAHFIVALQQIEPTGGPPARRGVPLARRDQPTREAIAAQHGTLDADIVTAAWDAALAAPAWQGPPVWVHGDLLPGNLLVKQGRLSAVIDFAGVGVGDPACDLMIAWNLFTAETRDVFRAALAVDDATWARGRGWALSQALIFIPYYLDTNPAGVAVARRTINEVLADGSASN
ncbi:MAG TPA: aminoglycoside phosphotransferase family protein, partial [Candidatus Binatia bacterium]|nr:aminoglycoside phosphotransferase family protein [Candidatus Binatia bacterium]